MDFTPAYSPGIKPDKTSLCLLYEDDSLWLLAKSPIYLIPQYTHFPETVGKNTQLHHLGYLGDKPVFLMHGHSKFAVSQSELELHFIKITLRHLFDDVSEDYKVLFNLGYHLYQWDKNSHYCGHCGSSLQFMQGQRGKTCLQCSHTVYPLVMPCIIVGIVKDNTSILLAEIKHNQSVFQSVLAGFIEAGETLEEAVAREVEEEVGIRIKNLRYYGSQPWGFSQSLMIAFMADYQGGEIQVDGKEIHRAEWYTVKQLPSLPPQFSIARQMIESFRSDQHEKHAKSTLHQD